MEYKTKIGPFGEEVTNLDVDATLIALEGEISAIMEILGGYVDGINILNEKILKLEELLLK